MSTTNPKSADYRDPEVSALAAGKAKRRSDATATATAAVGSTPSLTDSSGNAIANQSPQTGAEIEAAKRLLK